MLKSKIFISNYWHMILAWVFGTVAALIGMSFVIVSFPLWSILLINSIALCLIVIAIIITAVSKCKISYDGITTHKKHLLKWNDIISVKVQCGYAYIKYHLAYIIELKSANASMMIKTHNHMVELIKEYSKDCERFQTMFVDSLNSAEMSC